jgi:glycosyltransferase involved in cell wall biosynthesis
MKKRQSLREARVAWVVPILGVLGRLLYTKPLLESLAARCGELRVFTTEFEGDPTGLGFTVKKTGTFMRLYPNERLVDSGAEAYASGFAFVTPALVPALLQYRPDLIIANEFSLLTLYALVCRRLRCESRLLLLVETRPRGWHRGGLGRLRRALRRFMARGADAILTNNTSGGDYLVSELGAPAGKIMVRPYLVSDMASVAGLSREQILAQRLARGKEFPIQFLYVGQVLRRKGLHYALEAMAALLPQYHGKFCYDIVGDGPFRADLEQQCQKLGLGEHVRFHGRQPYETLWQWYLQADVFLFPTLSDYRALAPFEALSLGLPIVASVHDGGVGETVDEGRNGFTFDPRDTETLAKILARFLDAPEIIPRFGKRSLEMAEKYTLERGTKSLVKASQQALGY